MDEDSCIKCHSKIKNVFCFLIFVDFIFKNLFNKSNSPRCTFIYRTGNIRIWTIYSSIGYIFIGLCTFGYDYV